MKKTILSLSLFLSLGLFSLVSARPPSFTNDFVDHITPIEGKGSEDQEEVVYSNLGIDPDVSLAENIKNIFYPSSATNGGILWRYVTTIGVAIFFVFLVWIGIQFMMSAEDESKMSEAKMHFIRLGYGALLYFGAVWILGTALSITSPGGSATLVENFQNKLWFQLLSFFKALTFFAAIVATVLAGYRLMHAMGDEEQITAAKNGAVNVAIALVLMKVVDFIYLLAMDPEFFDKSTGIIIDISKVMGYLIGAGILGSIIYAGYSFITDGGSGEGAEKAGKILKTVFIVGLTIFLFLLIVYQVIAQFS